MCIRDRRNIGQNNATELLILVGFGVIATAFRFADYPLAPLLIGFILGPLLENDFARSMQLYDGAAFNWERTMTLILLIFSPMLILLPSYRARRAAARAKGVADGDCLTPICLNSRPTLSVFRPSPSSAQANARLR